MTDSREFLQLSAPLAWKLAPQLCRRDPATGENCAWTHGLWQILRILGVVGSIEYRSDYFRRALEGVSGSTPRVLLSGAADYATLECVLALFRARGVEPQITVVDMCETPLALNRWYAERVACTIETHCSDIMDFESENPFDAICTDAFIGRFPQDRRTALVARWHDLLRPGGLAVTYNRLRRNGGSAAVGFSTAQADGFARAVRAAAGPLQTMLEIAPETLEQHARLYAERHVTYPLQSEQELRDLFERAGFSVDNLELSRTDAGAAPAASGPSIRSGAEYAGITASRR